jgi:arginase
MVRRHKIIGAASGWGAKIRSCEEGPLFLKEKGCLQFLREKGIEILDWEMLYPFLTFKEKDVALGEALPLIIEFNSRLADCVCDTLGQSIFPVVIGGDHSNALGTWNGVAQSLSQTESFGLIWIDAHMDAHTLETTPSGAWHGMPLASLMGYGSVELSQLKRIQPVLKPEHLCLIGTRSFEEGEAELLKRLKVKIYYIEEVKQRGLDTVLKEALSYMHSRTKFYGVSLDVDVVDPSEAPGTGCFEPNGLSARELLSALPLIAQDEQLKAFELVEFNPHRDQNQKTFFLCQEILSTVLQRSDDCFLPFGKRRHTAEDRIGIAP